MNILFLDCGMGAAGDMLTAALLELFPNPEQITDELNGLCIPGIRYIRESVEKCGIKGTHMSVMVGEQEEGGHLHEHAHDHEHSHAHSHSGMDEIRHWISHIAASENVKNSVLQIYESIAAAESLVHGIEVDRIHFHEVGSLDALADVTAVCFLMEKLGSPVVYASPVHVGSGHVSCAHGILPVPAPATAELLKGIPIYGGQIQGELCTPTGAALLKYFVKEFGNMPVMQPEAVGYGMGKKDFAIANCIRAVLGTVTETENHDKIVELICNLDDMTGEEIAFAAEELLSAGAADVFTQPIGMKKGRPGVMLTVLSSMALKNQMINLIFRHTSTLGIRERVCERCILHRYEKVASADSGTVRIKMAEGFGTVRCKPEYEDLARIARKQNISLRAVRENLPADKITEKSGNA